MTCSWKKSMSYASRGLLFFRGGQRRNVQTKWFLMLPTVTISPGSAPPPLGCRRWLEGDPACCGHVGQSPQTEDMLGLLSVAQTPLTTSTTTSALSQVPWQVSRFSKPPLHTNAQVVTAKMMTDNTKNLRKGTSWLSRLDKRTHNVITHNTVSCGELTAMVIY